MPTTTVADALSQAKALLADGTLTPAKLEELWRSGGHGCAGKQWVMYIHAAHPTIHAAALNITLHEPVPGKAPQIDPMATPPDYASVHAAILDGWRVIHFPNQRDPFEDREIDFVGYEFILEKIAPANT